MSDSQFKSQKHSNLQQDSVKSPCVSVCVLNHDDVCTGCYRSGREISNWGRSSREQKLQILENCRVRSRTMNPFLAD